MKEGRKYYLVIFFFFLITVLACEITFQNEEIDYEATGRAEVKRTLQAIKDQAQSAVPSTFDFSEDGVDKNTSSGGENKNEGQPNSQNTQAPENTEATIDPSIWADQVLGDSEIVVIASYTPTDIPIPEILPPDAQDFPLLPTDTPTPSVTLISFNAYKCGRHTTVQFRINNNSDVALELADVACFHKETGNGSSASSSKPFHQSPNECPPGLDRLGAGVNSDVVLQPNWPYHIHSGEVYYCQLGLWETDSRSGKSFTIYGPEFIGP